MKKLFLLFIITMSMTSLGQDTIQTSKGKHTVVGNNGTTYFDKDTSSAKQSKLKDSLQDVPLFYGIKIDGTYENFDRELKNKGFHFLEKVENSNVYIYKGVFLSQSVELFVVVTPTTKLVWKVSVYFPEYSRSASWIEIKGDFISLKEQLTTKYGTPTDDFKFFSSPYNEGDGYEMTAVKIGKCSYFTAWSNNVKAVTLQIGEHSLKLSYENSINAAKAKEEKQKINKNQL